MNDSASNVLTLPIAAVGAERVANHRLPCSFDGCINMRRSGAFCAGHKYYLRIGAPMRPLRSRVKKTRNIDLVCTFPDCGKFRHAGELCSAHDGQRRRGVTLRVAHERFPALCTKCHDPLRPKTEEFFYRRGGKFSAVCKACCRDKRQTTKDREHTNYLKRTYNVSDVWYREQIVRQRGKCAICGTFDPGGKGRWSVDHNHVTGEVRELLCAGCNCAIGYAKESPETLVAAAEYIRRHSR